jgi:hypothetical protein
MGQLASFQVDHLLLTVGGNPLPCAVAAKLLLKPGGAIHLIYSAASARAASRIFTVFGGDQRQTIPLEDLERDSDTVFARVHGYVTNLPQEARVGLHYTGGTKVMAVHAHRAVRTARPDAVISYLDAARLSLYIERPDAQRDVALSLRDSSTRAACSLTLNNLWTLHGIDLLPSDHDEYRARTTPVYTEAARLLGRRFSNGERGDWHKAPKSNATPLRELPFPEVAEAMLAEHPTVTTVGEIKTIGGRGQTWLQGDWLEDYVLGELIAHAEELGTRRETIACSIVTQRPGGQKWFEVDVIAMRGHQIFVFSCTTSDDPSVCKEKLFEAGFRAAQLGGDEARFALVCDHPNADTLREQLKTILPSERYHVFDRVDLNDLGSALSNWFNGALRQQME